ncbi:hypothetical protein ACJROX_10940 [Pseudalkalibacillus sp. A8]|uniref:hypothetical protein n=1 Tax=Pseudalkalibacillus sp. A8 TaxID=3382641 RepID=UPI0038B4BF42
MKIEKELYFKREYSYRGPDGEVFEKAGCFLLPQRGQHSDEELYQMMYEKAYSVTKEVLEKHGGKLLEFSMEQISEFEFKRYEKQNKYDVFKQRSQFKGEQ